MKSRILNIITKGVIKKLSKDRKIHKEIIVDLTKNYTVDISNNFNNVSLRTIKATELRIIIKRDHTLEMYLNGVLSASVICDFGDTVNIT